MKKQEIKDYVRECVNITFSDVYFNHKLNRIVMDKVQEAFRELKANEKRCDMYEKFILSIKNCLKNPKLFRTNNGLFYLKFKVGFYECDISISKSDFLNLAPFIEEERG